MVSFPEPTPLNILEIGDGKDHRTMTYTIDKPHPGYGKDENVINQYGHTIYPKMVYPNGNAVAGVVVNNKDEENEVMGGQKPEDIDDGGPTLKEYTDAGFKASTYPPKGYKSKATEEEIKKAIAEEEKAAKAWGA